METAARILTALSDAPIEWYDSDVLTREALGLAAETGRTVYDCLYLALAVRCGCAMVNADRKLYNALEAGPHGPRLLWFENLA
jgi:predicted nucleic acid-binding protein